MIDGMLMATQYDLPWREDLFMRWDSYDASQSQEFIRHGYQVVVPAMDHPWCLHDCGNTTCTTTGIRGKKFVQEYRCENKSAVTPYESIISKFQIWLLGSEKDCSTVEQLLTIKGAGSWKVRSY